MSRIEDAFASLVGRRPRVISTIDHPFPSPPVHLMDGHLKLYQQFGPDALAVDWDVSHPDDRRYRYDLTTDTGLLSKNPLLYHYEAGIAYDQQTFAPAPLDILEQTLPVAIAEIKRRRRQISTSADVLLSRSLTVVGIARDASAPSRVPSEVARQTLLAYYRILGLRQLETFIATAQVSYSTSRLLTHWIPWCLRSINGDLSFERLAAGGLFQRAPFRWRAPSPDMHPSPWTALEAATLIENGHLTASLDVFLWSLAVARIPHFGDDRGFFERLSDYLADDAHRKLQLTSKGTDCARFLELSEDIGVLVDMQEGAVQVSSRTNHPTKHSRRTTFGSLFVALGDRLAPLLAEYTVTPFPPATVGYH